MMDIEEPQERTEDLVSQMAALWERSMRATHGFLAEADIATLRSEVRAGLTGVEHLAVARADGYPIAFAGAQGGKLEMLFVDADARGRGAGRALLARAVAQWGVHALDVNEQNPQARGFYEREGFCVTGRSDTDGAGRPFPLLRMVLAGGGDAR